MSRLIADQTAFAEALGQRLLAAGKLDATGLRRAQSLSVETDEALHSLLPKLGLVSEPDLATVMAAELGLALVRNGDFPGEALAAERFDAGFLKDAGALILEESETAFHIALKDPARDFAINAIRLSSGKAVTVALAVPAELDAALDRLYRASVEETVAAPDSDLLDLDADVDRLRDLASGAPVIRLVNQLINQAVESRASDIHVEPFEASLRVRMRLDGQLREVMSPARSLHAALISRLKIMANLDIAERRRPQDGRINLSVRGVPVDLRLSIVPTMHGETAVMRVLDKSAVTLDFDMLGIRGERRAQLAGLLKQPHGILLVTGPTGSGKTTTLYTALSELNEPDKKILTVEDPVEYQLNGVNQIQTQPSIGLTFPKVLRSLLRQDPDILMVGEIRDKETADIAVQAALTGHLVLSTLHTNDAVGTVMRLLDMGVEDYLVASTLNGVLAQRLVRRLCAHCREEKQLPAELAENLGLGRFGETRVFEPKGCDSCSQTGFSGRTAITEILTMTDEFKRLLVSRADESAMRRQAVEDGMVSLYLDGIEKVATGETSLDEVLRVARR